MSDSYKKWEELLSPNEYKRGLNKAITEIIMFPKEYFGQEGNELNGVIGTKKLFSKMNPQLIGSKTKEIKNIKEKVDHPKHYGGGDNPYEAIKVIEAWGLGFNLGNTLKYIARKGKKDEIIQELEKAVWYLNREIENLKK